MKNIINLKTYEQAFDFFNNIPDSKWAVSYFEQNGKCCMFGHCGIKQNGSDEEIDATGLPKLFSHILDQDLNGAKFWLCLINDEVKGDRFFKLGNTPKERVLNALVLSSSGILGEEL